MQTEGRTGYRLPAAGSDTQATAVLKPEAEADLVRFAQARQHRRTQSKTCMMREYNVVQPCLSCAPLRRSFPVSDHMRRMQHMKQAAALSIVPAAQLPCHQTVVNGMQGYHVACHGRWHPVACQRHCGSTP